jgi:hypothetical protein
VIGPEASVSVSGNVQVFGTNGHETVEVLSGNVTLDTSFSKGGDDGRLRRGRDRIHRACLWQQCHPRYPYDLELRIPISLVGTSLHFADGDRTLSFDTAASAVKIGDQVIGTTPVHLLADAFA